LKKGDRHPQEDNATPVDLLSLFASGTLTVGVNDLPLLKVDAEKRSVKVEARGVKECGIKLSDVLELQRKKGAKPKLSGSESTAKELSEKGWRLTLSDKDDTIIAMGRGVSRLTGYVVVNPLMLRKILKLL